MAAPPTALPPPRSLPPIPPHLSPMARQPITREETLGLGEEGSVQVASSRPKAHVPHGHVHGCRHQYTQCTPYQSTTLCTMAQMHGQGSRMLYRSLSTAIHSYPHLPTRPNLNSSILCAPLISDALFINQRLLPEIPSPSPPSFSHSFCH